MEPRFGHDFSPVRVHTDTKSAESARAVDAMAYTVGRDIVFGADQYKQGSPEGQSLLAHELAHVVQQRGNAAKDSSTLALDEPEGVAEQQALLQSQSALSGAAREDSPKGTPLSVQRQQIPDRPTTSSTPLLPLTPAVPKLPTPGLGDIKELTKLIKNAGDAATRDPLVRKLRDLLVRLQPIMPDKDAQKTIDDAIRSLVKDGVDAGIMAILGRVAGKSPTNMPEDRTQMGPYAPEGIPGEHIFQSPKIPFDYIPKAKPGSSFEYRNGPAKSYAVGAAIKFRIIFPENFNLIQGSKRVVIVPYANRHDMNPESFGQPVFLESGSSQIVEMTAPQKPGRYVVRVNTGMGFDDSTIQEFEVTAPEATPGTTLSKSPGAAKPTK
jgi:hypothetical protein